MLVNQVTSLGRRYRHFNRYREIATVLFGHGFGDLLRRTGLHRHLRWSRLRRSEPASFPSTSERVRVAFEELGPTFVKFGQVLSTRLDLCPAPLIAELVKLQDAVPPFPADLAVKRIEAELHQPLTALFRSFQHEPMASGSLAQVHEAWTIAGDHVVVKVRRPGIETVVTTDLEIMAHIAELLEKYVPESLVFEPARLVREFAKVVHRELDFSTEASHLERFARDFAGDPRVHVPCVYRHLTSSRVVTMEFMEGLKISRLDEFAARGLDRELVALRGAQLVMEQVLVHGFFHADPHPGNVLVLPHNVVCFLDCGMVGILSARQRELLSDLIIGLVMRDENRIAQAVFRLSGYRHPERQPDVEADIAIFTETHLYRPLRDIHIGTILTELTKIVVQYDIHLPPEFFVLSKTLTTMEGVGRQLSPDLDLMSTAEPFARRLIRERLGPLRVAQRMASAWSELQTFVRETPAQVEEIIDQLRRGDLRLKFEHRGLEHLTHVLDQVSNRIAFAIVLAALLIGSALMVHSGIPPRWHGLPVIGVLGFCVSGVMGFSLLHSILRHGRM